jgi:hypothetical protein
MPAVVFRPVPASFPFRMTIALALGFTLFFVSFVPVYRLMIGIAFTNRCLLQTFACGILFCIGLLRFLLHNVWFYRLLMEKGLEGRLFPNGKESGGMITGPVGLFAEWW